jgi:hypothetical protein
VLSGNLSVEVGEVRARALQGYLQAVLRMAGGLAPSAANSEEEEDAGVSLDESEGLLDPEVAELVATSLHEFLYNVSADAS